jgi:hypothetical protein
MSSTGVVLNLQNSLSTAFCEILTGQSAIQFYWSFVYSALVCFRMGMSGLWLAQPTFGSFLF